MEKTDALSPRMVHLIAELVQDWRRLDERIAAVSAEIESLAEQDEACQRVMTVPGVGPNRQELCLLQRQLAILEPLPPISP